MKSKKKIPKANQLQKGREKQPYDSAIVKLAQQRQHDYFDMKVDEERIIWKDYSRDVVQYISTKARNYGRKKDPRQRFSLKKTKNNAIGIIRIS